MVGLVKRANNNHITWPVFWGKGKVTSFGLQYTDKCRYGEDKLHGCCWKDFGLLTIRLFLKISTGGDKALAICSSISRQEQKMHHSCVLGGLALAIIWRCALLARTGVGGGRSRLHFWNPWWPAWRQLRGLYIPARRGSICEVFPHMACDGDLSHAVLQAVGPSPVGLYQLSVAGRWLLLPAHGDTWKFIFFVSLQPLCCALTRWTLCLGHPLSTTLPGIKIANCLLFLTLLRESSNFLKKNIT